MAEKELQEIARPLRDQYDRGLAAYHKDNFDYAITLLAEALRKEPAFFDARQALRAAQFKRAGARRGGFFKRMLGHGQAAPLLARAQLALRTNPADALPLAEQILEDDPANAAAHKLLADAAGQLGLHRTAVLSLEIVFKNAPGDREAALRLARALIAAGQGPRADRILADLLAANPADLEVAQVYKDLGARRSLNEQGYAKLEGGGGSYRDVLRNEAEAVSLEQEQRVVKSGDVADKLIAEHEARLAAEPGNLKTLRTLGELYTQKRQFDRALAAFQRIADAEGKVDPGLERAVIDTRLKQFDDEAAAAPGAPARARIEAERDAFRLAELQKLVERYPTDLHLRYDLGAACLAAGKVTEAIRELQRAQNNPNRRVPAMGLLGEAFARRGMLDLAVRTLENALKEKAVFDEEKKALLYRLGRVYEQQGRADQAVEQFKLIYEADIGYRDVADKVDAYYAAKGG